MGSLMRPLRKNRAEAPLLPIPLEGPFHFLEIDPLGTFPVPMSNSRYMHSSSQNTLLVGLRHFVADLSVKEVISLHGAYSPYYCGTNFLSKLDGEVCGLVNTEEVNTTASHPQCSGLTKRMNHAFAHTLSQYVSVSQDDCRRIRCSYPQ